MATREENLKKINAEREKLSDDELEQVAGGDSYECFDISMSIWSNDELKKQFKGDCRDTAYLKKFLHDKLGIDAEFNRNEPDFYNPNASANKYTDVATGKSVTHHDVIDKISSYGFPELLGLKA